MKLTIAVLALLCLSSAVSASSNAADFKKLPLAGLFAGQHLLADANITVSDLIPQFNISDVMGALHSMPKFQLPTLNVSGAGAVGWGNASEIMVPLVPLFGLKAAKKALPLLPLLALLNSSSTLGADVNFTMPSLPSVNISQVAVPLHALLALPKAHKALPLLPLLGMLNASSGLNISMPHMPSLNISNVGVPLGFLMHHSVHGLPLLAGLVGNMTGSLPVFTSNVTTAVPAIGALPLKALFGLKALPLALLGKPLIGAGMLGGLLGNITAGLGGNMTGGLFGNVTAGPSVDVNLRHGSFGMKNVALNLTHPTLGLKNLAVALNITHPELAMKLAALNLTLPVPDFKMGSRNVSLSVPMLEFNPQMSNVTVTVPMAGLTMPGLSMDLNGSADGNSTGIQFTKPGLTMGSANITLPMLNPQIALKLAQLGFNVPTAELGLRKANLSAAVPLPDLTMATRALNLTLPVPDLGSRQVGLNLTVPDIQLPRLELNVSGMGLPKLGLDALKSATLLSWLKDAGFYAMKNVSFEGNSTIDLAHHGRKML